MMHCNKQQLAIMLSTTSINIRTQNECLTIFSDLKVFSVSAPGRSKITKVNRFNEYLFIQHHYPSAKENQKFRCIKNIKGGRI